MKVLILSCDTGEGHNSAAAAVAGALTQRGIESHVFDPLVLAGKYAERFVSGAYTTIMKKAPSAFNALYRAGDIYSSTGITSPVYHANARYAANLRAFIETNGYDRVVCTHLYPMETLTAIRKSGDFTVPCYGVLTDYTCIPFLAETDLDGYFIAHEDLRAELVAQLGDVHINRSGVDGRGDTPNLRQQLGAGGNAAGVVEQIQQQVELSLRQVHSLAILRYLPCGGVNL